VIVKTVKVSAKGQFTLPAEVMRELNLRKGTEMLLVQDGDKVFLRKASAVGKEMIDDLAGFENLGLTSFARLWDNPYDEVWNDV
jgi:AbrB family looped-hinge helix DNA binding protein